MTREEAIKEMIKAKKTFMDLHTPQELKKEWCKSRLSAYDMAIKALSQEPTKEEQALLQKWRDNRGIGMKEYEDAMNALQEPCEDAVSQSTCMDCIHNPVCYRIDSYDDDYAQNCGDFLTELSSVTQKSGKWIDYRDEGFAECPFCGHATNCEDDIDELHYCFYCGARMVEPHEREDKE